MTWDESVEHHEAVKARLVFLGLGSGPGRQTHLGRHWIDVPNMVDPRKPLKANGIQQFLTVRGPESM